MTARSLTRAALGVALAYAWSAPQARAEWPDHPVKVIVPYAAGGITDIIARLGAEQLQARFKQPFVVENESGASGTIAAQRVARADPDGYTMFFTATNQISVAPFINRISYDPIKDFKAVAMVGSAPFIYTVSEKVPAATFAQFIAHVKANPGQVTFGSSGVGSLSYMSGMYLRHKLGVEIGHVAYRGVGPGLQDLLAGHIDMMPLTPVELKPQFGSGKIRPLAVLDDHRTAALPDVPLASETIPTPPMVTWEGFLVPAGTPQEIVEAMSDELVAASKRPAFLDRLSNLGVDSQALDHRQFAAFIKADLERWRGIVRDLGLKPLEN